MVGAILNTSLAMKSLTCLPSLCFCLTANRETAFVHAISSAGVMYTLTRNCSLGDFDNCGCDDSRNGQLGKERQAVVPLSNPGLLKEALLHYSISITVGKSRMVSIDPLSTHQCVGRELLWQCPAFISPHPCSHWTALVGNSRASPLWLSLQISCNSEIWVFWKEKFKFQVIKTF